MFNGRENVFRKNGRSDSSKPYQTLSSFAMHHFRRLFLSPKDIRAEIGVVAAEDVIVLKCSFYHIFCPSLYGQWYPTITRG